MNSMPQPPQPESKLHLPAIQKNIQRLKDNEELRNEITRLAGHINAAQYRFLKLLAVLIEQDGWGGDGGIKSPAHWLNFQCGIALGAAREKVRVAKCLDSLPLIDEAFSTGAISYSKVRAMTRTATPENEDYLLVIAEYGTAQHVETLVRKYQRAVRLNDPEKRESQQQAREFVSYHDYDGMLVFNGKLPAEQGAVFIKAINTILGNLRKEADLEKVVSAESEKNEGR